MESISVWPSKRRAENSLQQPQGLDHSHLRGRKLDGSGFKREGGGGRLSAGDVDKPREESCCREE